MSRSSAFQSAVVHIVWPFGAPAPLLRCPVTGQVVLQGYDPATGENGNLEEPDWANLPTVRFCYVPEVGEFAFIVPSLQAAIDEKREAMMAAARPERVQEIEDLSDFEILESYVEDLGQVPLVYSLTTSGMACGPVSGSVYVGLDLAAVLPDVEDEAA